jgi:hypothetical protein
VEFHVETASTGKLGSTSQKLITIFISISTSGEAQFFFLDFSLNGLRVKMKVQLDLQSLCGIEHSA